MVRVATLALFELAMRIANVLIKAGNIYQAEFRCELLLAIFHLKAIKYPVPRPLSKIPPGHPRGIGEFSKRNLDAVADFLESIGIEFFWIPTASVSPNSTRLAIHSVDKERFLTSLSSLDSGQSLLCSIGESVLGAHYYVGKLSSHALCKMVNGRVRLFLSFPHPALDKISYSAGCEVEIIQTKAHTYHLEANNDITGIVNPAEEIVPVAVLGRDLKTWAVMKNYQSFEVCDFDIDLVYTWVDGGDDEWVRQRMQYSPTGHHDDAVDDGRFRSRDELKYSLRSISYFANIFRHIFIVTNGQIPAWLDTNNSRVSIVPHSEIFRQPESSLPTFNSHAIEANLHRIPGLSEHFVYLNDDMLFCDFISKNDLFSSKGNSHIFLNEDQYFDFAAPDASASPFHNAGRQTALLIYDEFGKVPRKIVRHAPYVNLKSVLENIDAKHNELLLQTEKSKFRSPTDVSLPASLGPYWALVASKGVESALTTSNIKLSNRLDMSLALIRLLALKDRQFLCINESKQELPHIQNRIDAEVRQFLERYFPVKSEFEKAL